MIFRPNILLGLVSRFKVVWRLEMSAQMKTGPSLFLVSSLEGGEHLVSFFPEAALIAVAVINLPKISHYTLRLSISFPPFYAEYDTS